MTRLILLVLLTLAAVNSSFADTVYIRDTIYVPLRGGQSTEYRILHRGLRSGTPLERLATNEESGYTQVRTPEGIEGWIQTQYLVEEPIASAQLETATAQLEELEAAHQQSLLRFREASESSEVLEERVSTLEAENERLTRELSEITALSSDVIAIDEQNKALSREQEDLFMQIDALNEENQSLADDRTQRWFLLGAGTILTGLLFGFWIGRRIYARRINSGWA